MPLDLSISKSCGLLIPRESSALRVRTDLIGPDSANQEKALDLTSNSKRQRRHLEESDEGDFSPRDLTMQSTSNSRFKLSFFLPRCSFRTIRQVKYNFSYE